MSDETGGVMDAPDGDGYWAFEGRLDGSSVEKLQRCVMVRRNSIDKNFYAFWFGGREFKVSQMIGKWYRLHMPWETPSPVGASVPSDIAETIELTLKFSKRDEITDNWNGTAAYMNQRIDAALAWLAQQRGQG